MNSSWKKVCGLVCVVLLVGTLGFAIDISTAVTGVGVTDNFSLYLLPTNVSYRFGLPFKQLIKDQPTSLALYMNTGYEDREIKQNPVTGTPWWVAPLGIKNEYGTVFSSFELNLGQGLGHSEYTDGSLFWVDAGLYGRAEQAIERLALFNGEEDYHYTNKTTLDQDIFQTRNTLSGTPDLSGGHYILSLGLFTSFSIDRSIDSNTTYDGFNFFSRAKWSPKWLFNDMMDGKSDYYQLVLSLNLGKTLYQLKAESGKNLFSVVLSDYSRYRFLDGKYVPKYAENGGIFNSDARNLNNFISTSMHVTFYGPEFLTGDCYPYLFLFAEMGYGWGSVNNTNRDYWDSEFVISYGFHLHLRMFRIFHVYFEMGYNALPALGDDPYWDKNYGFFISL